MNAVVITSGDVRASQLAVERAATRNFLHQRGLMLQNPVAEAAIAARHKPSMQLTLHLKA